MFRDIPEAEALGTVEAAWKDGIRYFDNAPFYGAGLAEIRMGEALAGKPRDEYVISTKVDRVILDEVEDVSARDLGEKSGVFQHGRPNKVVNEMGRAHVRTPVTNANIVCRLLLEQKRIILKPSH